VQKGSRGANFKGGLCQSLISAGGSSSLEKKSLVIEEAKRILTIVSQSGGRGDLNRSGKGPMGLCAGGAKKRKKLKFALKGKNSVSGKRIGYS